MNSPFGRRLVLALCSTLLLGPVGILQAGAQMHVGTRVGAIENGLLPPGPSM
jgi:hypothetical protein